MSQYTDVIDFKSNYFSNFSKIMRANVYDTDGERVFWSKIMLLKVDIKDPTTFLFKYNYVESSFKKWKMNARKAKRTKLCMKEMPRKYKEMLGTSLEKKNDLQKLYKGTDSETASCFLFQYASCTQHSK